MHRPHQELASTLTHLHLWDDLTSSSVATLSERNCGVTSGSRTQVNSRGISASRASLSCFTHRTTASKTTSSEVT